MGPLLQKGVWFVYTFPSLDPLMTNTPHAANQIASTKVTIALPSIHQIDLPTQSTEIWIKTKKDNSSLI